jgi:hypothetical protein
MAAQLGCTARPMGAGRWVLTDTDSHDVVIVLCEADIRRSEPDPTTN